MWVHCAFYAWSFSHLFFFSILGSLLLCAGVANGLRGVKGKRRRVRPSPKLDSVEGFGRIAWRVDCLRTKLSSACLIKRRSESSCMKSSDATAFGEAVACVLIFLTQTQLVEALRIWNGEPSCRRRCTGRLRPVASMVSAQARSDLVVGRVCLQ